METILLLVVIGTSIWVLVDAKSIGIKKGQIKGFANVGPWGWFFVCLLMWIIGFPLYLAKRGEFKLVNSGMNETEENVKKCPECAETIKKDARVCRHCGAKFEPA